MKILFVFATRSRPQKCNEAINSVLNNLSSDNYEIILTTDDDDKTMREATIPICNVKHCKGASANKISAINRGMTLAGEYSILIVLSDDMRFITKGFDDILREDMQKHFPDLDGVLHYPDQHQGSNCMTMSIMGRKYYERDGFIYNPRFESLWSDIVAQEQAQIRDKYKFIDTRLFDHLHPSFGDTPYDAQYQKTEDISVRSRDYQTYIDLKKEYDPTNIYPIRGI